MKNNKNKDISDILYTNLQKVNPDNIINNTNKVINTEDNIKLIDDINNGIKKKRGRKKKNIDIPTENITNLNFSTSTNSTDSTDSTNILETKNTIPIIIPTCSSPKIKRKQSISEKSDSSDKKNKNLKNMNNLEYQFEKKIGKQSTSSDSDDNSNDILKELLNRQRKNICASKKLLFNDIKRISKFLSDSIFDENKCSLWTGYITNEKNQSKGTYINFYFNKKKIALHRLLFINFIGEISNDEYIKFSCDNKGKCCNIHHMKKYTYNKAIEENKNKDKKLDNEQTVQISSKKDKFIVEF